MNGAAPYLEVQENAKRAEVEFGLTGERKTAVFRDPPGLRSEETMRADRFELMGIRRSRGLASSELLQIAAAFEAERVSGKTYEELIRSANEEAAENT